MAVMMMILIKQKCHLVMVMTIVMIFVATMVNYVRDMMILKCTNILPPPPQHHNSNITNFFLSDFSVWSIGPKIVAYKSCLCRLRVQRNANYERHAQHHVLPTCGREHCLLQLQAYTQIPSCRKISGGLIAQVALLPRGRRSAQS